MALDPLAADGDGPALPDPGDTGAASRPEGASDEARPDAADGGRAGALVVSDCHHLFDRHIDGFEALDAFFQRLALSDPLVVTSWNRHAWSYLDVVRDVGDSFPVTVEIPPLDADELRTVIEAHSGPDLPDVVDTGQAGRIEEVVFDRCPLPLPGGRSVGIPYPKPNTAWLAARSVSGTEESVEAVVFERLRRVARGNPGVAKAAWERAVTDGEIAPSYIEAPPSGLSLDDDAAFLLWTVVAVESARIDRLDDLFEGRPVEATLQALVEQGLVTVQDRTVAVAPGTLPVAVDSFERRRLVW